MRARTQNTRYCERPRRGFSLLEVSICTLLVGLVLVASMRSIGAVIRGRMSQSEPARGKQLAQELMTEILNQAYIDEGASPLFGPEESTQNRSAFDDVDDYDTWSASPPEDRAGNPLPNLAGWDRAVAVAFVDPADPLTASMSDQGVKRITVTIHRSGEVVSQLVSLRTDKYIAP